MEEDAWERQAYTEHLDHSAENRQDMCHSAWNCQYTGLSLYSCQEELVYSEHAVFS